MRYSNLAGADPEFVADLERLVAESPYTNDVTVFSGKRSLEHQRELFDRSDRTGHTVAFPTPNAPHVRGVAADLGWHGGSFKSMPSEAQRYLAANALKYGLAFPMSYEPWHIQKAGDVSGGSASNSLAGGIRDGGLGQTDTLGDAPMAATKPVRTDPLPQTSGYMDVVSAAGHDSLSPSGQRGMVASALRTGGARRSGGGLLHGGIFGGGLLGIRGNKAQSGDFTTSQKQKLEARLGADWADASREDQLGVLYPAPKAKTGGASPSGGGSTAVKLPANASAEIDRIAALPPLEYEIERGVLADQWGIRREIIDRAVTLKRKNDKKAATPDKPAGVEVPIATQEKMLDIARKSLADGVPREKVDAALRRVGIDPGRL